MNAEVELIRAGKAIKLPGGFYEVNGRTYALHGSTWHPASGPGVHMLDRGAFKAYGILNEMGGPSPEAIARMTDNRLLPEVQEAAMKAWREINRK